MTVTHYDVLGVRPDADPAELRRAYLALARTHHPDRRGGDPARMRAINDAWATLGDPDRRRSYDVTLTGGTARPGSAAWTARSAGGAERDDLADLVDRDADLEDDRPYGPGGPTSGWFAVVPVGLFAGSVAVGVVGLLLGLPGLLGLAFLLFALSCLAFVAAPLLALYASRRGTGAGPPPPSR